MKKSKKIFTAISLGILSAFVSGTITASAAELVVTNGPGSMTSEQKAEWVKKIGVDGYSIAHDTSLSNNRIELIGGDYGKYRIKGGYAELGDTMNNSVTLKKVTGHIDSVYGGFSVSGFADGNVVNVDGFSGRIGFVIGGAANQGVSDNIVKISNVKKAVIDEIMGGDGDNTIANNKVIISGDSGFYVNAIYGGYSNNHANKGGTVSGNSVSIFGNGTIISPEIYGGYIKDGNAENNQVNISGNVKLEGLKVDSVNNPLNIYGGYTENGDANNNIVDISSKVEIKSDAIYGGYTKNGDVKNNIVNISGDVKIESGTIYGGYAENGGDNNNKITFKGLTFTDNKLDVYGGYSKLGNVSGNVIEVDNSIKNKGSYWNLIAMTAGETVEGNAIGNKVVITDTLFENNDDDGRDNGFWGGASEKGDVIGNSVIVDKSHLSDYLVGGTAINGNALNNSVTISNSEIDAGLIRGADVVTGNGKAENNRVFIENSKLVGTEVEGGNGKFSDDNSHVGEIVSNIVKISNSVICGEIYGGKGYASSSVSSNAVQIVGSSNAVEDKDCKFNGAVEIYGGRNELTGTVQGNIVQIFDSTIILNENSTGIDDNRFYGGYGSGDVNENLLAVNNSNVEGLLVGGSSRNGNVANNIVAISGEGVKGNIYGGLIKNGVGNATHNKVFIDNSIVRLEPNKELPLLAGGVAKKGAADNNYVAIVNSEVGYGGSAARAKYFGVMVGGAGSSSGSENTFVVSGSEVNLEIVGGYSDGAGKADGNEIIISDSEVNGIYGGLSTGAGSSSANNKVILNNSESNSIYGGFAEGAGSVANNNLIVINSSTVKGEIVGGVVLNGEKANDNTVVISGASDVSQATIVGGSGAESQNNTLTLDGWSGSANSVKGFNNYSFQKIKDINDAVLTVGSASDIDVNTKFDVSFAGSVDLQKDDTVTLIKVGNGLSLDAKEQNVSVGTSLDVEGSLVGGNNGVDFKVEKIILNRQTDLIGSANSAAAAFLSDCGELAVDGLAQINSDEYGFNTFAATHGANSDYDNSIDLKGWNNIVGVGHNAKTEAGDFAWGVFYEGGTGEYDTMNSYNGRGFNVDGKAVYNGYGAAARLNKDNGVYYEAGLRAGKLKNDLSNALLDVNGMSYGYKTESDYFGYHVGVGRAVALADGDQFDVYARYYHTKVDSDSFTVAAGDTYSLDEVYSDRIRLGGRYQDNLNEAVKVYYGAAWEYEFSGESEGSVKGYRMEKSDLGGSTFVGEIGLLMNNPGSAWTVDMALQAYGGQREGIGGKAQATYHF